MRHIAIIGSGPAGCYLADHLSACFPTHPSTFWNACRSVRAGSLRSRARPSGHESDYAGTGSCALARSRQLLWQCRGRSRCSSDELMSIYDAVVLATGRRATGGWGFRARTCPASLARAHSPAGTTVIPSVRRRRCTMCVRRSSSATAMSPSMSLAFWPRASRAGRLRSFAGGHGVAGGAADRGHSYCGPPWCCRCQVYRA